MTDSKVYAIGDCIISPLGYTSEQTYKAIVNGESKLELHCGTFDLPQPFFGSIFERDSLDSEFYSETGTDNNILYSTVEKAAILAAMRAIRNASIDPAADNVIFVISSTKGNISKASGGLMPNDESPYVWSSSNRIAQFFGNKNKPVTVSLACTSGIVAQIAAMRALKYGGSNGTQYKYAVVIGAEELSKFIISGFQSFRALSTERCMPFDKDRKGLNLGESAAAIVYTIGTDIPKNSLVMQSGAIRNDANHISAPSRTAEGLCRAISALNADKEKISFINAHGTATLYNDDMESVSIERSGWSNIPVNSLKGYLGHTLGAAGVVETILSCYAVRNGVILPCKGTVTPGTVGQINPCMELTVQSMSHKNCFVKLISGFGGSNAAALFQVL